MHASLKWALVLMSGMMLMPSRAEAISYSFTDCAASHLCGAPAPPPESPSLSTTYDFSNEAAVAASIASVYFSADGALSGMPEFDRGAMTDTSTPAVAGPTLSTAMAFDDIITALDAGSSTSDGLRVSAHLQGMDPNASLDIYIARESFSVPEPTMMALFGLGLLALGARARRKL